MSQIILSVSETVRLIAVSCQRRVAQRLSLVCTSMRIVHHARGAMSDLLPSDWSCFSSFLWSKDTVHVVWYPNKQAAHLSCSKHCVLSKCISSTYTMPSDGDELL